MQVYVDTSALAKWYLNEVRSDDVETWLQQTGPVAISSLTALEMRSLLARRRRAGDISIALEMRILATFDEDIARGYLQQYPLEDEHARAAIRLIASLTEQPLRSLDALHLAIAQQLIATTVATADRTMAQAAEALTFEVVRFD